MSFLISSVCESIQYQPSCRHPISFQAAVCCPSASLLNFSHQISHSYASQVFLKCMVCRMMQCIQVSSLHKSHHVQGDSHMESLVAQQQPIKASFDWVLPVAIITEESTGLPVYELIRKCLQAIKGCFNHSHRLVVNQRNNGAFLSSMRAEVRAIPSYQMVDFYRSADKMNPIRYLSWVVIAELNHPTVFHTGGSHSRIGFIVCRCM